MKSNYIITAFLLLVLAFMNACKNKDIDVETFKIEKEAAFPSANSVTFKGSYSFSGIVEKIMVNIGERDDLCDARSFEMQIEGTDFSRTVEELKPNTPYYYNYTIVFGTGATTNHPSEGRTKSFITARVPTVRALEVLAINDDSTSIRVKCAVVSDGGLQVTKRGICWSTFGEPTMNDDTIPSDREDLIYYVEMEHLDLGKTYYIRAYAINEAGPGLSQENPPLKFSTPTTTEELFNIECNCIPENGGLVTGGGNFHFGDTAILIAVPNNGYRFAGWDDGNTNNTRNVIVTGNATYKAIFSEIGAENYNVTTHADPVEGGIVEGGGQHEEGEQIQLSAIANTGYIFKHWDDGSIENPRNITVNSDMEFTAVFKKTYTITVQANDGGTAHIGNTTYTTATFEHNDTCWVHAIPNPGYDFKTWTKAEDNTEVSDNANYNFAVTDDCNLVANFTQAYTIEVFAEPPEGGEASVIDGPMFHYGDMATLKATPNLGYDFLRWNDDNTDSIRQVRVVASDSYTAYFKLQGGNTVNVSITVSLQDGNNPAGTTISFLNLNTQEQQERVFDATGYLMLSLSAGNYRIIVAKNGYEPNDENINIEEDISLSYSLRPNTTVAPMGAINGKFTINNSGSKVYFSEGNLQYRASDDKWRFAEHQYEYIGNGNSNIGQYYNGWIDLYGWATSGWDCNNMYYHPWDSNNTNSSQYGPPGDSDLIGNNANSDWGVYNTIYSGTIATTGWRTLTIWEWKFVFEQRSTISGKHYAKAQVNGTNGVILLPDDWNTNYYVLSNYDSDNAYYSSNVISSSDWSRFLEAHGAVFLPAAGGRGGNTVTNVGNSGSYWSTSSSSSNNAYYLYFNNTTFTTGASNGGRCYGRSVRLVCPVEN